MTADDFEVLARNVAPPDAARVACLPATANGAAASGTAALPGAVRLLVVPRVIVATDDLGRIAFDDLRTPPRELLRRMSDHATVAARRHPARRRAALLPGRDGRSAGDGRPGRADGGGPGRGVA